MEVIGPSTLQLRVRTRHRQFIHTIDYKAEHIIKSLTDESIQMSTEACQRSLKNRQVQLDVDKHGNTAGALGLQCGDTGFVK